MSNKQRAKIALAQILQSECDFLDSTVGDKEHRSGDEKGAYLKGVVSGIANACNALQQLDGEVSPSMMCEACLNLVAEMGGKTQSIPSR